MLLGVYRGSNVLQKFMYKDGRSGMQTEIWGCILFNCIIPNCNFAKCTQLVCLLSAARLFISSWSEFSSAPAVYPPLNTATNDRRQNYFHRFALLMCSQHTSTAWVLHTVQHQALTQRWQSATHIPQIVISSNLPKDCTHAGGAVRGVCRRHTLTVDQAEHPWEDGEEGQLQRHGSPPFRPDADVSQAIRSAPPPEIVYKYF